MSKTKWTSHTVQIYADIYGTQFITHNTSGNVYNYGLFGKNSVEITHIFILMVWTYDDEVYDWIY